MADEIVPRDEEADAMGEQNNARDLPQQDIKLDTYRQQKFRKLRMDLIEYEII